MATSPESLAAFFQTLSDTNRLKIINLLKGQEREAGEIASLLTINDSAVAGDLAILRELGLVNLRQNGKQRCYRLNDLALAHWKQQVQKLESLDFETGRPQYDDSWIDQLDLDEYDRKVLRDYTRDGRLREIPAKHKKLQAVARWLITKFEPGVTYTEHQVNDILTRYHQDYAQLRRCLIDFGLMQRERNGASYWRLSNSD